MTNNNGLEAMNEMISRLQNRKQALIDNYPDQQNEEWLNISTRQLNNAVEWCHELIEKYDLKSTGSIDKI